MPYYIKLGAIGCDGWATVKDDGEVIGCHQSKADAIAQMVAVSLAEDIEPGGERALPDNYRPALAEDVPEGRACGNCHFYDEGRQNDDGTKAWCERWADFVDGAYYCNAWQPHEEDDESGKHYDEEETRAVDLSAPEYMVSAAKRGLRLYADGEAGAGLQDSTVRDARAMAQGTISEPKWRKIGPWIARHLDDLDAVDAETPITPGLVAHLLWGSGPTKSDAERAQKYAEGVVRRLDAEEQRAPAPPKDQIEGSDENKPGSASGKVGGIELNEATVTALENKAEEHNADMQEKDRPSWTRVTVGALKAVYRRGAGAYSTSHRPGIGRAQWAMARVNAFIYLSRTGSPQNASYITDNDLLNSGHPKYSKSDRGIVLLGKRREEIEMMKSVPEKENVVETRRVTVQEFELRAGVEGSMSFCGYAAVYNSPSEPLPFTETIAPGAFDKTLRARNNVKMYLNHDSTLVLASTRAKTMKLTSDSKGLLVESDLPDTSYARDLAVLMERGDVDSMSFGFSVPSGGDRWGADGMTRELKQIRLHEVSVVTGFPAYAATSAALRSLDMLADATGLDANKLAEALTMLENGKTLSTDHADLLAETVNKLRAEPDTSEVAGSLALKRKQIDLLLNRI